MASAQLDKENAHFCISEAMIAAMEQMKFKRDFGDDFRVEEESDPEIVDLKQRIRLRRRQKLMSMKKFWAAYYSKSDST